MNKLSNLSKLLLFVAAISLIISIFVPIWQIQLDAPQYPEGLILKIHANKLSGNVDIINGLNHYIGMKTLHADDFIEFRVLTYIILFFALFALIAAVMGRKKIVYTLFTAFVLFGIIAMVDFWRWEYAYGHDLNPHAAIIVPGMAYQPPLIGFKQLLNFGAYSIPDIGGWLFVASGLFMLAAVLIETNAFKKFKKGATIPNAAMALLFVTLLSACGTSGPQPINLNKDNCDYCKMTISDQKFASEILTSKGRLYKFDDVICMKNYKDENVDKMTNASFYVSDYLHNNDLVPFKQLTFIKGENIQSPMGGHIASFTDKDSASTYAEKYAAELINWNAFFE